MHSLRSALHAEYITLVLTPNTLSKVTLGDGSSCAAPKLWNALPLDITSESTAAGRPELKTYSSYFGKRSRSRLLLLSDIIHMVTVILTQFNNGYLTFWII